MPRYRIETISVPESTANDDRYLDLPYRRIVRVFSNDISITGFIRVLTEERAPNEEIR